MAPTADGTLHILLVDDEADIRANLRRLLRRLPVGDVAVTEADSGEAALAILETTSFDLVLTDHRLGRASGVDVLERVLKDHPSTVRVLMTAYEDMAIAQDAVNRAHVDGFVRKPWDNRGLLDLLGRLLKGRTAARATA